MSVKGFTVVPFSFTKKRSAESKPFKYYQESNLSCIFPHVHLLICDRAPKLKNTL